MNYFINHCGKNQKLKQKKRAQKKAPQPIMTDEQAQLLQPIMTDEQAQLLQHTLVKQVCKEQGLEGPENQQQVEEAIQAQIEMQKILAQQKNLIVQDGFSTLEKQQAKIDEEERFLKQLYELMSPKIVVTRQKQTLINTDNNNPLKDFDDLRPKIFIESEDGAVLLSDIQQKYEWFLFLLTRFRFYLIQEYVDLFTKRQYQQAPQIKQPALPFILTNKAQDLQSKMKFSIETTSRNQQRLQQALTNSIAHTTEQLKIDKEKLEQDQGSLQIAATTVGIHMQQNCTITGGEINLSQLSKMRQNAYQQYLTKKIPFAKNSENSAQCKESDTYE